jgi:hypothetical protein
MGFGFRKQDLGFRVQTLDSSSPHDSSFTTSFVLGFRFRAALACMLGCDGA